MRVFGGPVPRIQGVRSEARRSERAQADLLEPLAQGSVRQDAQFAVQVRGQRTEALRRVVAIALCQMGVDQRFGGRLAERLGGKCRCAGLDGERQVTRCGHGAARSFQGLHAQQPKRILHRQHPFVVPSRKDVFSQEGDFRKGECLAIERSRGRTLRLGEVRACVQYEFAVDGVDPAGRKVPHPPAQIRSRDFVGDIRPQVCSGDSPRHGQPSHREVSEDTPRGEGESHHRIRTETTHDSDHVVVLNGLP